MLEYTLKNITTTGVLYLRNLLVARKSLLLYCRFRNRGAAISRMVYIYSSVGIRLQLIKYHKQALNIDQANTKKNRRARILLRDMDKYKTSRLLLGSSAIAKPALDGGMNHWEFIKYFSKIKTTPARLTGNTK